MQHETNRIAGDITNLIKSLYETCQGDRVCMYVCTHVHVHTIAATTLYVYMYVYMYVHMTADTALFV